MNVIKWMKGSNRWKHLAGGIIIGFVPQNETAGLYGGILAASALEYKDHAYGNQWDWIDWALTVAGTAAGCLVRYSLKLITG